MNLWNEDKLIWLDGQMYHVQGSGKQNAHDVASKVAM